MLKYLYLPFFLGLGPERYAGFSSIAADDQDNIPASPNECLLIGCGLP